MKKSIPALILAICLVLSMSVTVFAAGSNSSTTATVPVTLTVANEYRAVNVTVPAALPVEVINGTVVKVGSYENFSGAKTIALKINGCPTKGAGKLAITDSAFPVIGAGDSQKLTYFAKVSGDAPNAKDVQAAHVVITISIVD